MTSTEKYNKIIMSLKIIAISLAGIVALCGICFGFGGGTFGHPLDFHYELEQIIIDAEKKNEEDARRDARHREWVRDIESIWRDNTSDNSSYGTMDSRDDNRGER